jgi:nucleoid DNA-binding protein
MNYSNLLNILATMMPCPEEKAKAMADELIKWMTDMIVDNQMLTIPGFGKFVVKKDLEYIVSDSTGKKRKLYPPKLTLHFVPASLLNGDEEDSRNAFFSSASEMLVKKCGTEKHVAERFPVQFFRSLMEGMESGELVTVDFLGEFVLTKMKVDNCVYGKIAFNPDEQLAQLVNRPFSFFQPVDLRDNVVLDDTKVLSPLEAKTMDNHPEEEVFLISQEEPETPDVVDETENLDEAPQEQEETAEETVETTDSGHQADEDAELEQPVEPLMDETATTKRGSWVKWAIAGLVAACLLLFFLLPKNKESVSDDNPQVAAVAADSLVEDSLAAPAVVADNNQPQGDNDLDLKALNAQIPYGAYDIVGVDTVITVMPGQTLADISRIFLGTDIQIYLVVLNDGNNDPKEGDKYKIPKLKLRK